MYLDAILSFYRFRFVVVGIVAITLLMLSSALVTMAGTNTVLDARTYPTISAPDPTQFDSPNAVTSGLSTLLEETQVALLSAGRGFYSVCRWMTNTTVQAGKATVRGTAAVVGGAWHGVVFVSKGVGAGVMFTVRLPGKVVGSVTHAHAVNALVRPSDDMKVPVVIDSQTSADMLAQYNAEQKQKIAKLLADQLVANEGLEGSIVAGDPNHGGYPAKWDGARQDSATDSWGMYNRECVSYAAWKVYQTYGDMPYWGGVGNANQWVSNAKAAGIATGSTPQAHSVAISMHGYYGHAMWVEKVQGNMIYVSQYNYDLHGHYSEMWVNASELTYLYFK